MVHIQVMGKSFALLERKVIWYDIFNCNWVDTWCP